jgi:hypothetical protein
MMMATSWPAMATAQQTAAPVPPPLPAPQADPAPTDSGTGTAPQDQPAAVAADPSVPADAAAQAPSVPPPATAEAEADEGDEDIVVTGRRPPGSVVGDIPAEVVLSPADVRSYGVSSVSDLLTELGPQTRSGAGGPPVVLLDGKRISGFQEIRDIPTEAILRVDILPEEVALKYGYTADQKVVNFVLRRRFRSTTLELADAAATQGGRNSPQGQLGVLTIRNGTRFNLDTKYQQSSALTESERNIAAAATESGVPTVDQRPYRTLLPFTRSFSTNAIYAQPIGDVSASVNGELTATQSTSQLGLPLDASGAPLGGDALEQRNNGVTGHLGTSFNGRLSPRWLWTVTGAYDRSDTRTFTDAGSRSGGGNARSISNTGEIEALVNGPLFALPAGDVSTAIRVGADTSDFNSRSFRNNIVSAGDVSRDSVDGRVNIDVPIASRSRAVLGWLGNLSVNGNAAVNRLSDFGTLTAFGYGFNWGPIDGVRVIGSINQQDVAPGAAQLGNAVVVTPNVRVFDFVQGQTVTVATVTGGNPDLRSSDRRVTRLGINLKPWSTRDLTFTANYNKQDIRNSVQGLQSATAAFERAFPDRFIRDDDGNLIRIDRRAVNFARSETEVVRLGINFSKPIKSKIQKQIEAFRAGSGPNPFAGLRFPGANGRSGEGRPDRQPGGGQDGGQSGGGQAGSGQDNAAAAGGRDAGGDRAAGDGARANANGGGRGFGGGGFGGGRGGQGGGRIQFALYDNWTLTRRQTLASGGPVLDALRGDAISSDSNGQPRHQFEAQAGYSNNGIGVRLSGNYATATRINGGTATAPQTLRFGGLATADLRLFADLGQQLALVKAHPWVRGARVTFSVTNILNTRQQVRDANGVTPISYQPDTIDPLGRTVRLSLRKLFF